MLIFLLSYAALSAVSAQSNPSNCPAPNAAAMPSIATVNGVKCCSCDSSSVTPSCAKDQFVLVQNNADGVERCCNKIDGATSYNYDDCTAAGCDTYGSNPVLRDGTCHETVDDNNRKVALGVGLFFLFFCLLLVALFLLWWFWWRPRQKRKEQERLRAVMEYREWHIPSVKGNACRAHSQGETSEQVQPMAVPATRKKEGDIDSRMPRQVLDDLLSTENDYRYEPQSKDSFVQRVHPTFSNTALPVQQSRNKFSMQISSPSSRRIHFSRPRGMDILACSLDDGDSFTPSQSSARRDDDPHEHEQFQKKKYVDRVVPSPYLEYKKRLQQA